MTKMNLVARGTLRKVAVLSELTSAPAHPKYHCIVCPGYGISKLTPSWTSRTWMCTTFPCGNAWRKPNNQYRNSSKKGGLQATHYGWPFSCINLQKDIWCCIVWKSGKIFKIKNKPMLYTKKGDDGTTKTFGCDQRISKSSNTAEALGSLDEINSFLGLCKVQSAYLKFQLGNKNLSEIVHDIQKNLFIIQAEIGGADKNISEIKVKELEEIVDEIERELPPIKHFFISGGPADITSWQQSGAGLGAIFDIARTIARRAERRVIAVAEEISQPSLLINNVEENKEPVEEKKVIGKQTLAYLNRLSSALYALARYSNHKVGIMEEAPDYR